MTLSELAKNAGIEPCAYARKDTVLNWRGQSMNVAWMFPSPKGLHNPIALYTAADVETLLAVRRKMVLEEAANMLSDAYFDEHGGRFINNKEPYANDELRRMANEKGKL